MFFLTLLLVAALPAVLFLTVSAQHRHAAGNLYPMSADQPSALSDAVKQQLADAPLTFVANRGQMDEHVAYYVPGGKTTIYFSQEGVTFAQIGIPATTDAGGQSPGNQ